MNFTNITQYLGLTFAEAGSFVLYLLLAFAILMFMITIHELGHYAAGKLLKFKINEFSIGMGPKIFSKKNAKTGEVFSIRAVPLGGFCAFEDEDALTEEKKKKDVFEADEAEPSQDAKQGSFVSMAPWKRIVVLFSGAFFNFVSAILIVIIAFSAFGDYLPTVGNYIDNSPAYNAATNPLVPDSQKLLSGDIILEVNGKTVYLYNDISVYIAQAKEGKSNEVLVLRNGQKVLLTNVDKGEYITQKLDENGEPVLDSEGKMVYVTAKGFGFYLDTDISRHRFSFGDAIGRAVPYCFRTASAILEILGKLITGALGIENIGGPITTVDMTMQVARTGLGNILFLITMISVNLAVFNLLPIPALDGSKIVFCVIEWIRRKPINRTVESWIHFVGFVLLLGFVIIIDIFNWWL